MKKFIKIFVSLMIVYGFIGCAEKQVIQKNFKINKNTKEVKSEANKAWKELDKEK